MPIHTPAAKLAGDAGLMGIVSGMSLIIGNLLAVIYSIESSSAGVSHHVQLDPVAFWANPQPPLSFECHRLSCICYLFEKCSISC